MSIFQHYILLTCSMFKGRLRKYRSNNEYSLILTDIEMSGISSDQFFDYLWNKIKKSTLLDYVSK